MSTAEIPAELQVWDARMSQHMAAVQRSAETATNSSREFYQFTTDVNYCMQNISMLENDFGDFGFWGDLENQAIGLQYMSELTEKVAQIVRQVAIRMMA